MEYYVHFHHLLGGYEGISYLDDEALVRIHGTKAEAEAIIHDIARGMRPCQLRQSQDHEFLLYAMDSDKVAIRFTILPIESYIIVNGVKIEPRFNIGQRVFVTDKERIGFGEGSGTIVRLMWEPMQETIMYVVQGSQWHGDYKASELSW